MEERSALLRDEGASGQEPQPSYGAAGAAGGGVSKVGAKAWDNAAWLAFLVPVFLEGAGETLSGLVLPDMAVVNYAGSDVCSGGPSDACDRAITATTAVGVSVGIMGSILTAIFSPVVGVLGDRFGRRPMLLLCLFASQFATIVSWGVYYFQWKFYWFFVASLIPAFVPAQVLLSMWILDMTSERSRASAYGLLGAVQVLYGFTAPLMVEFTAASANPSMTATALNMSITCKISGLFLAVLFLPESTSIAAEGEDLRPGMAASEGGDSATSGDRSPKTRKASFYQCLGQLLQNPTAKVAMLISIVSSFMNVGESQVATQYTKNRLSVMAQDRAGLRLCGVSAGLFANTVLLRMFRGALSVKLQVLLCCLFGLSTHVIYILATSATALYPAAVLGALGSLLAVYVSTLNANVATISGMPLGTVLGVFTSVGQIGMILGPPVFSSVFLISMRDIFWGHSFPQLAFCFGIVLNLIVVRLLLVVPEAAYEGARPSLPREVSQDPQDDLTATP
ncbi:unnamed protein product [Symbiodinium sp. CCMP2592]|nr:unnamed protein product [Symbiodinium sp. CCMP2592]